MVLNALDKPLPNFWCAYLGVRPTGNFSGYANRRPCSRRSYYLKSAMKWRERGQSEVNEPFGGVKNSISNSLVSPPRLYRSTACKLCEPLRSLSYCPSSIISKSMGPTGSSSRSTRLPFFNKVVIPFSSMSHGSHPLLAESDKSVECIR